MLCHYLCWKATSWADLSCIADRLLYCLYLFIVIRCFNSVLWAVPTDLLALVQEFTGATQLKVFVQKPHHSTNAVSTPNGRQFDILLYPPVATSPRSRYEWCLELCFSCGYFTWLAEYRRMNASFDISILCWAFFWTIDVVLVMNWQPDSGSFIVVTIISNMWQDVLYRSPTDLTN